MANCAACGDERVFRARPRAECDSPGDRDLAAPIRSGQHVPQQPARRLSRDMAGRSKPSV